jgi:hypothetical protein
MKAILCWKCWMIIKEKEERQFLSNMKKKLSFFSIEIIMMQWGECRKDEEQKKKGRRLIKYHIAHCRKFPFFFFYSQHRKLLKKYRNGEKSLFLLCSIFMWKICRTEQKSKKKWRKLHGFFIHVNINSSLPFFCCLQVIY